MTRFQLDHDWQANMSTPRVRIGEGVKIQLLLALCAIWILLGLVGHAPWKPLESTGISVVKNILDGGSLVAPLASGAISLDVPPLYYLSAAASAKILSPFFSTHDGARLINAAWLSIMLLMVGMTGRELWSRGIGRHATFIMIGTIGLVVSAHSLTAEIASLTSIATGFYALALAKRRPWRASGLLGIALSAGFLSYGVIPFLILLSTALILPLLFKAWRTPRFVKFLSVAVLLACLPIILWLIMLHDDNPSLLMSWLHNNLNSFHHDNHLYFARILLWFAWPALPLALLGLWHYRQQLLINQKLQLISTFFICSFFILGAGADAKDISALPLLLPLVALGAGSVEHLKRGAAAALNWFGVLLFGLIGSLIWLGWLAMVAGYPAKIKTRMQFLSGVSEIHTNWSALIAALIITAIWIFVCIRAKQTNKSTITNWAVGMTFGWSLLMTLWLPLIDSAKSYQPVFASLNKALPENYNCINSLNVGRSQRLLFNYHTNIKLQPFEVTQKLSCDLYFLQDNKADGEIQPSQKWQQIWSGKRAADRKESFRLFQRAK